MIQTIELIPASNTILFVADVFVPIIGAGGLFPTVTPEQIQPNSTVNINIAMQPPFDGGIILFGDNEHMAIAGSNIIGTPTTEVIHLQTSGIGILRGGIKAANANIYGYVTAIIK